MTKKIRLSIRIIMLSAGMAFLWATGGFAAESGVTLSQSRENGVYAIGEEIVFTVTAPSETKTLDYQILLDGILDSGLSDELELKNGTATVSYRPKKPECVMLTTPSGKKGPSLGAVVAPFDIQLSRAAPDDFDAFWDKKKAELSAIPMNVRLTPVEEPQKANYGPKVECFDLQLDSMGDKPVSGYYVRPVGAAKGSLPATLNLHSAGVRGGNLRAAWVGAKRNMISLDINAHGLPNAQTPEYYKNLSYGALKGYDGQGMDDPNHYYFLGMYLRIVRAIDFLTTQPEWDGKTVILQGSSQGGGQSLVGAGLDGRVTEVRATVPAFCDLTGQEAGRQAGWPGRGRERSKAQLKTLGYFDACHLAARTKAKVYIVVGLVDTTCTPVGILAAYNQFPGEKSITILPSRGHGETAKSKAHEKDPRFMHKD